MVDEQLTVVVDGTSIIVTMLNTEFSVTYQKQSLSPHLVLMHTSLTASGPAPVRMPSISLGREPFTQRSSRRGSWAGSCDALALAAALFS